MLAGEDVAELSRLLLEPRDCLGVGDLALPIRDLLCERGVLRRERDHLGVEMTGLRHLAVDGECNKPADSSDEHDCNPAQRDGAVDRRTLRGTDGATLFPALSETNGVMWRRVPA
jgi:hypothetical protein